MLAVWSVLAAAPTGDTDPANVLKVYCRGCHNAKVQTAGLSVDGLHPDRALENPVAWEKILRKVRTRSMPPAGLPRPSEASYATLGAAAMVLDADYQMHPKPGRTDTFRRLNRTEYQNTIRDLLHLDVDVTALLPRDEASHGFDNITLGDLSPTLMERYLSAAKKISRLALGTPVRSPGGDTLTLPPDLTQDSHFDGLPFGTRGGMLVRYTFPANATYELQIRLARDRNAHVEGLMGTHEVELLMDGERVKLFAVAPPSKGGDHSAVDRHLTVRLAVKAGPHTVGVTFPSHSIPVVETERQPWFAHFNMDRHPRLTPAIYSVTVNGPYDVTSPGDTPSRRRILICRPESRAAEASCASKILTALSRSAFRRPVTAQDAAPAFEVFRSARKSEGFEPALELRSALFW